MEIALHPAMPTYSGGLGMLAGDMLRAAADRGLPMVAVTLLHRKGYFYQTLDGRGWQTEELRRPRVGMMIVVQTLATRHPGEDSRVIRRVAKVLCSPASDRVR
jgi:glucan phosphorylase